jgi:hypothetical protein
MKEKKYMYKLFNCLILILFLSFTLLLPYTANSQNLSFTLQGSRMKIAVVPGGLIQFRFSINNLATSQTTYVIDANLVNQTQTFAFRLVYQNQSFEKSIVVNPSSSKEITVEVSTTQNMPVGAKGAIKVGVKTEGSSDSQKQEILLNFILTKQIIMLLKQNSSTVQLSDQDPVNLDVAPYIQGGRTFVPLRFIGESFGAKVDWIPEEKKIIYTLRGQEIILWINKTKLISNGIEKTMDTPPEIKPPGRTFVPLRIISEELGATVEWNEISRQIKIVFTVS